MEFIDYYKILEIPKTADDGMIKKAYRKLARKYHPDLNPNDKEAEKKFKQLNEANEVLGNPENRKKYDQYGKDWKHAEEFEKSGYQPNQSQSSGRQQSSSGFSGDFSDFFQSMYGGQSSGRQQSRFRGQDLNAELHLGLADVLTSKKQTLTVNGKNIRITIPAGVENGQIIKIHGHGTPGSTGGPNGDLYITFLIADDPVFKRDGSNIYINVTIDLYTAMLGGEAVINTLDGKVKMKVAPETQPGTKVKLKGKGMPVYKKEGEFGDLYVTYAIQLPSKLSEEEKKLFTELSNIRSHEN
ncbi:J domain-containing protein [Flavobacterium sp. DGU11]|uniref:J domain-containing protein n=1 Tax=Flavobacterium arundinis TaxID=3139143 RepID=A0ABU9HYI3_9FLAO